MSVCSYLAWVMAALAAAAGVACAWVGTPSVRSLHAAAKLERASFVGGAASASSIGHGPCDRRAVARDDAAPARGSCSLSGCTFCTVVNSLLGRLRAPVSSCPARSCQLAHKGEPRGRPFVLALFGNEQRAVVPRERVAHALRVAAFAAPPPALDALPLGPAIRRPTLPAPSRAAPLCAEFFGPLP